jgi:hypothetical protein
MDLFYDVRDAAAHAARGSRVLDWLDDLGAKPLAEAQPGGRGFLFAGARSIDDYARPVAPVPLVRDRPGERAPLLLVDTTPDALAAAGLLKRVAGAVGWSAAFDAAWRTTAAGLAAAIYEERAFDRLPILANALEEAGGGEPAVLDHCRVEGPHCRSHFVERVPGKE